jgi:hypothetical protein
MMEKPFVNVSIKDKKRFDKVRVAKYIGSFGAIIGGVIGVIISEVKHNDVYLAICLGGGIVFGCLVGLFFNRSLSIRVLQKIDYKVNVVSGLMAFILVIIGLIGFLKTGKLVAVWGAIIFALAGVFLIKHRK